MPNGDLPIFVKWAGGKSQLIKQFKPLFPHGFGNYFEPFIGAGAVFFYVRKNLRPKKMILSDTNRELINCFKMVKGRPKELLASLEQHKKNNSKEYFYEVRKLNPKNLNDVERASRFIYLNKTCFNGLYRVNSKGQFNVPFGKYKNPKIADHKSILEANRLLKGVVIKIISFEKVVESAKERDFVYFDPPYLPISKTSSFTSYTKDSFGEREQRKLAEVFRKLDERGCFVMLSNSNHPLIRELYKGYDIKTVKARRAISCIGAKRGEIKEVVVRNYKNKDLKSFIKTRK